MTENSSPPATAPERQASASSAEAAPEEAFAIVEVFGHRQHYGRISEVERFGTKMCRIDILDAKGETKQTLFYGGASLFSVTPTTREVVLRWSAREGRPAVPLLRSRYYDDDIDDADDEPLVDEPADETGGGEPLTTAGGDLG